MVDVAAKAETHRVARASGAIRMQPATLRADRRRQREEGRRARRGAHRRDPGRQAHRRADPAVPPAADHPRGGRVRARRARRARVRCTAQVETLGRTGVEMEALTAVQVGLLTVYDMCKAADRGMVMGGIRRAGEARRQVGRLGQRAAELLTSQHAGQTGKVRMRSAKLRAHGPARARVDDRVGRGELVLAVQVRGHQRGRRVERHDDALLRVGDDLIGAVLVELAPSHLLSSSCTMRRHDAFGARAACPRSACAPRGCRSTARPRPRYRRRASIAVLRSRSAWVLAPLASPASASSSGTGISSTPCPFGMKTNSCPACHCFSSRTASGSRSGTSRTAWRLQSWRYPLSIDAELVRIHLRRGPCLTGNPRT